MTLLLQLADIDKELGVTDAHDRDHAGKLEYVETQIHEMKSILWRLRCDTLLGTVIPPNEGEEIERRDQLKRLKGDISAMTQAVDVLTKLRDELTA